MHEIEVIIRKLLDYIGDDADREGLQETPSRIMKSWDILFSGYDDKEEDIYKVFDESTDSLIILKHTEFTSFCEHHWLPFYGHASIAYIPENDKIIGASKLARLLNMYSRRLQIQERIGQQIVNSLMENLECRGAACIIEAQHFCMLSRGVMKQDSVLVTSTLDGVFRGNNIENISARNELMSLL